MNNRAFNHSSGQNTTDGRIQILEGRGSRASVWLTLKDLLQADGPGVILTVSVFVGLEERHVV